MKSFRVGCERTVGLIALIRLRAAFDPWGPSHDRDVTVVSSGEHSAVQACEMVRLLSQFILSFAMAFIFMNLALRKRNVILSSQASDCCQLLACRHLN